MQVSYNLLKEYVDIDISAEELAQRLTTNGVILDRMEHIFLNVENIVVGQIMNIQKHQKNKNLSVCQVDVKDKTIQIVCGAKNMEVSNKVVVALEGAELPQIGVIKSRKFENVLSSGMLCSASELDVEIGKSSGIIILDNDAILGEEIKNIINFKDTILDFEIHSNRPDLLCIIGIAREIAVILNKELRIPKIKIKEEGEEIEKEILVRIDSEDLCPRYTGRIIRGIEVKESPIWLKWKLRLLGLRPINNIVDITNFVMMETGQPLHAFDLDLIKGTTIIVRKSKPGETICTLDEIERQLPENSLVIADIEKPIAIAGIMGGKYSEINQNTKNIFLESAYFNPVNNRKSTIKFGLRTEASNRFEKGIDQNGQIFALNRSADLISCITFGKINSGVIDTNEKLFKANQVNLRIERVNRILGPLLEGNNSETKKSIINILGKLDFSIRKDYGEYIEVIPPSFRGDVEREIDLIEEIARIYGYNKIKPSLFNTTIAQETKSFHLKLIDRIKEILIGCGLNEVISYSFISPNSFSRVKIESEKKLHNALKIMNPLTKDYSFMRTSLISNLLEIIQWNINRQAEEVKIFEVGKIYLPNPKKSEALPLEELIVSGAAIKIEHGNLWEKSFILDIYYIKGIIETILQNLKIKTWEMVKGNHPAFHPLRNGKIIIKEKEIGIFGEIHPKIANNYRIPGKITLFEINLDNLINYVPQDIYFSILPKYPSVQRDLSLVVRDEVHSSEIIKVINSIDKKLIKKTILFDMFKGKQIDKGYKSLAYSIVFQADDHTLTDQEVENVFRKIIEKLIVKFDAKIREK